MSRPLLENASRRWTIAGGLSLIGAPLAFLTGTLIHPGLRSEPSAQLAVIESHPDAWYATHLLGLVFVVLMVPAVLTLMRLLGEREPRLSGLGGALALIGLVGWAGIVAIFGWVFLQMAQSGDRGEMSALFERVTEEPETVIPTRGLSFLVVAGMLVLAAALYRSRLVPRWSPFLIATGFVGFALGAGSEVKALMVASTTAMTVGLGAIGLTLLGRPKWQPTAPLSEGA